MNRCGPIPRTLAGRLALAGVLAACGGRERPVAEVAQLEVEWTGADTGRLAGAATAEWCGPLRVLEIRAVAGDSGVGIALYPRDTVRPDSYAVVPPERADSIPPSAAVALRYFAETAVKGYQSDSGRVLVSATAGGRLSGRFTTSLKSASDGSRLRAGGVFRDVQVVPATRGCLPRPARPPADTGIH
jgi:hypothetical protein